MDENTPAPESISTQPTIGNATQPTSDSAVRFRGLGTNFRAKLIGIDDVPDSRGDEMCQESILKLKAAVQASGRHKQKVVINVSLEGIKIVDVLTGEVQHVHPVHRISFIARDLTDRRAFGYVYGAGEGRHQFFGVKTAKAAEVLVLALRDLFQVVYDMKKKEIEDVRSTTVTFNAEETSAQQRQSVPVSQFHQQANEHGGQHANVQSESDNILNLEQQLTSIQQGINNIDSIGPWTPDLPNSPDASGNMGGDLFGINTNSTTNVPEKASYSDQLFDLGSPVVQPAPQPGAKLTREQILSGFGGGPQQSTFPGQAGMPMMPPNQMQYQYAQAQQTPQMFGAPQASMAMGMFPPRPVIPPRPGAMKPPAPQLLQGGAPQNPFGDSAPSQSVPMLAPTNTTPGLNLAAEEPSKPTDPFANLIPGMGAASAPSKKDMFKNFEMAKPPQPPPRTNPPTNAGQSEQGQSTADFENYFLNSVGGVPIADGTPVPAARNQPNLSDPFGMSSDASGPPAGTNGFANDQAFAPFDFSQNTTNSQSLIG